MYNCFDLVIELDARPDSIQGREQLYAIRREELARGILGIPDVKVHDAAICCVDHQFLGTKTRRAVGFSLSGFSNLANPCLVKLVTEAES